VYTNTEPFLASPFFLALRELFGDDSEAASRAFRLHRLATSSGEFGKVRHKLEASQLVSEVELRVGTLPGVPLALTGTVVSTADLEMEDGGFKERLRIRNTSVKGTNVLPALQNVLGGTMQLPTTVPVSDLYSRFRGQVPESSLLCVYLDADMRIVRTSDDDVFVFCRAAGE